MRTNDFAPFWRSSIGFDRLFDLMNSAQLPDNDGYPPYDILRLGDDAYRITLALAGFTSDDLNITAQQNLLTIAGRRAQSAERESSTKALRHVRSSASSAWQTMWR